MSVRALAVCGAAAGIVAAFWTSSCSRPADPSMLRPFEVTARNGHVRYVLVDAASANDDEQLFAVTQELLLRTAQTGVLLVRFWSEPQSVPRRLPETCDNVSSEVARVAINFRTRQRVLLRREQFRDAALDALECHQRVWRRTTAGGF